MWTFSRRAYIKPFFPRIRKYKYGLQEIKNILYLRIACCYVLQDLVPSAVYTNVASSAAVSWCDVFSLQDQEKPGLI
jgi:hypothetical protein